MKCKIFLAALLGLAALPAFAASGDLHVTVAGVRDNEGAVRLALYRNGKTFGRENRALTIREAMVREGEANIVIRSLPAGRYAILAYHDRNGNRKFDRRLGLIDAEGHGLSNNPASDAGRSFDTAAFDFAGAPGAAVRIDLNYCHPGPDEERSLPRSLKCWVTLSD
ncbi:MAG: DUF2141 domain-containing protein [Porticoccaceae bacterium]